MSLFWRAGTTLAQKAAFVMLLVMVFWPFQVFISHSFVPSEGTIRFSIWIALGFTAFFLLLMFHVQRTSSVTLILPYKGFRKVGMMILMPAVVYGFAWINVAVAGPQVFTYVMGKEFVKNDVAIRERSSSRKGCRLRLKTRAANDFLFFYYCLPEHLWSRLPESEFGVQLRGKASIFGTHISDIEILHEDS